MVRFGSDKRVNLRVGEVNDTKEFDIEPDVATKTFERVQQEIKDAQDKAISAERIVLGVEQYKAVCIHMCNNDMEHETVEQIFGLEVIVVPGPMVFIPRDKRRMLFEYGRE